MVFFGTPPPLVKKRPAKLSMATYSKYTEEPGGTPRSPHGPSRAGRPASLIRLPSRTSSAVPSSTLPAPSPLLSPSISKIDSLPGRNKKGVSSVAYSFVDYEAKRNSQSESRRLSFGSVEKDGEAGHGDERMIRMSQQSKGEHAKEKRFTPLQRVALLRAQKDPDFHFNTLFGDELFHFSWLSEEEVKDLEKRNFSWAETRLRRLMNLHNANMLTDRIIYGSEKLKRRDLLNALKGTLAVPLEELSEFLDELEEHKAVLALLRDILLEQEEKPELFELVVPPDTGAAEEEKALHFEILCEEDVNLQRQIFLAIEMGFTDKVKHLVCDIGSPVEARSFYYGDRTPLLFAAYLDRAEIVDFLCEIGADLCATDMFGRTPLHMACEFNCEKTVSVLCQYCDEDHFLMHTEYPPEFHIDDKYYLFDGAPPRQLDSPYWKKIRNGTCEVEVPLPPLNPSHLAKLTTEGDTPLHLAVRCKNPDLTNHIFERFQDPENTLVFSPFVQEMLEATNRGGKTPSNVVMEAGSPKVQAQFGIMSTEAQDPGNVRKRWGKMRVVEMARQMLSPRHGN